MINRWPSFTPSFFWCTIFNSKCRNSIQYMDTSIYCFWPKILRNVSIHQHTSNHVHNCAVLSFSHVILLWCIRSCKLPLYSMHFTESYKIMCIELATAIYSKDFNGVSRFFLNLSFKSFKQNTGFRFFLQEINPCLSTIIIYKGDEVPFVAI